MRHVLFVPNDPAIASIQYNPSDMLGRDLRRRRDTLEFRGRMSVGVASGVLQGSLHSTPIEPYSKGLQTRVGSPLRYAAPHHEGAGPHIIRPRKAKALRFRVGGRIIFASRVNHPGNRPNPYLTRWLREAVR